MTDEGAGQPHGGDPELEYLSATPAPELGGLERFPRKRYYRLADHDYMRGVLALALIGNLMFFGVLAIAIPNAQQFEQVFTALVGLAGAATGFYYGNQK